MMFTVETVSCVGACGLAPTMMVNDQVYPSMTPEKALANMIKTMTLCGLGKSAPLPVLSTPPLQALLNAVSVVTAASENSPYLTMVWM